MKKFIKIFYWSPSLVNIATNDAMVTAKMNDLAADGWELAFMATGVESADKEPEAIFITRYVFKRLKSN